MFTFAEQVLRYIRNLERRIELLELEKNGKEMVSIARLRLKMILSISVQNTSEGCFFFFFFFLLS